MTSRNRRKIFVICAVLHIVFIMTAYAAPGAAYAQNVEHPIYKSWAKHPVGTVIVFHSVTTIKDKKVEETSKTRLISIDNDKVITEQIVTSDVTGSKVENPAQERIIRKLFPLLPGVKPEDIGKPRDAVAQGEETLKIGGKDYKTVWFDVKGNTEAGKSLTRTWMCEEIPGRLIKSRIEIPSINRLSINELVEIKKP